MTIEREIAAARKKVTLIRRELAILKERQRKRVFAAMMIVTLLRRKRLLLKERAKIEAKIARIEKQIQRLQERIILSSLATETARSFIEPHEPKRTPPRLREGSLVGRVVALLQSAPDRSWVPTEIYAALEPKPKNLNSLYSQLRLWIAQGRIRSCGRGLYGAVDPIAGPAEQHVH